MTNSYETIARGHVVPPDGCKPVDYRKFDAWWSGRATRRWTGLRLKLTLPARRLATVIPFKPRDDPDPDPAA